MAYEIVFTKNAELDYENIINYLFDHWSLVVVLDFVSLVNEKLNTLSYQPFIGLKEKNNVRSILLTKHNRLFYIVTNNTIIILNIFDTRQNPNKKPY